jgi:hypothetical protein
LPARSSPGIFENSFNVPVPRPEFSKKFYFPSPEFKKKLGVLGPRPEFSGNIPFPSLEVSRNSFHFQARKIADTGIRSTILLVTKQISYHYSTSSPCKKYIFLLIFYEENYDL